MRALSLFLCLTLLSSPCSSWERKLPKAKLNQLEREQLGKMIWQRECGSKELGLTTWNPTEPFPSLGIGHFIWLSEKQKKDKKFPFKGSFPKMIAFCEKKGVRVPKMAKESCPWATREVFQKEIDSPKMRELRQFLLDNMDCQVEYIIHRFNEVAENLLKNTPKKQKNKIVRSIKRLARSPSGLYAMIDYLHFKGEGRKDDWGLRQVLLDMEEKAFEDPTEAFVASGKKTLKRRVKKSKNRVQEEKWYPGWCNRLDTYLESSTEPSKSSSR